MLLLLPALIEEVCDNCGAFVFAKIWLANERFCRFTFCEQIRFKIYWAMEYVIEQMPPCAVNRNELDNEHITDK
jgi:hypothetical protein